jgi:superfamily II DNA or RNA helicase
MSITLRKYQREAIDKINAEWDSGNTDVLLTMATGGGKTAVFLSLIHEMLQPGQRALVLAHRKELIDQPRDRMLDYYPEWEGRVGQIMAKQNDVDKPLTIATVQTLYRGKRLDELLEHGQIDLLVTDEAHHQTINNTTYSTVLEKLREVNPDMRHLGVTATPIRSDGDGIGGVYQVQAAKYGIVELIKLGYLIPVRWLAIQVGISLAEVNSANGDFVAKKLANVFETDNCFDLVVESHQKYAADRQAVAFTTSVAGAYALAGKFKLAGIKAEAADGTTDKTRRQQILDDFRNGNTQILCNVGLYTEGLDIPEVSCIHQVRPTKSDGLYTQMIGRALRIFPGKKDALILDYAPIEARNIAMIGDVLGTPIRKEAYLEEGKEEGEVIGGLTFDGDYNWLEGNPAEIVSRQLDYLDVSPFVWHRGDNGWMTLGLGKASDEVERTLVIGPPKDGKMDLYLVAKRPTERSLRAYPVMQDEFNRISEWAEDYSERRGNAMLATKQRRWRREAASEAQIKFAKRLGCKFEPAVRKGELAREITHALAMKAVGIR